jgi:hypothetical protein
MQRRPDMNRQGTFSILLLMMVLLPRGSMAERGPIRCDVLNDLVGNRWEVFADIGVNLFESSHRPHSCFKAASAGGPLFICAWNIAAEEDGRAIRDSIVRDIASCLKVEPEGIRAAPEFNRVQCMESQSDSRKDEVFPVVDITVSYVADVKLIFYYPSTQRAPRSAVGYGLLSGPVSQNDFTTHDRAPRGSGAPSFDGGSTIQREEAKCDWVTHDIETRNWCSKLGGTVSLCSEHPGYAQCYSCDVPPKGGSQGDFSWHLKSDGTCDGVTLE